MESGSTNDVNTTTANYLAKYLAKYLDWASAAPVSAAARKAFIAALDVFGNPSSPHALGAKAREMLENARLTIALLAGTKTDSIIFTSGATEANALAIQGHVKSLLESGRKASEIHLLYLPTAHASVVDTMQELLRNGILVEPLQITDGQIDLKKLAEQVRSETAFVSIDLVCGETGTIYNARDVRRTLDAAQKKLIENGQKVLSERILLHVDASQAPFVESYEHTHLGADLITLDAQKVGGVRGIGVLIRVHPSTKLLPIMQGGGQEQGLRPGTESPALAEAFAVALADAQNGREEFIARAQAMRDSFIHDIKEKFGGCEINVGKHFSPHIINMSFPHIDPDYAVMVLSEAGFSVSTRSACETDSDEGSHTVLALTGDTIRAASTLRISWGPSTPEETLRNFQKELISTLEFLYQQKAIN
jgi:cysteine desulfurase